MTQECIALNEGAHKTSNDSFAKWFLMVGEMTGPGCIDNTSNNYQCEFNDTHAIGTTLMQTIRMQEFDLN